MKIYAIKSKAGSVGFRSVVVVDTEKELEELKKVYDVEELKLQPVEPEKKEGE